MCLHNCILQTLYVVPLAILILLPEIGSQVFGKNNKSEPAAARPSLFHGRSEIHGKCLLCGVISACVVKIARRACPDSDMCTCTCPLVARSCSLILLLHCWRCGAGISARLS